MEFNVIHRREGLILTAIDIINELGIQGLSIREVAKRQGITTAAIFSHFKSKSDLILAVLDHFTQYDSVIEQVIQIKGIHSKEAIIYYLDAYYTYYENYPAITAIIMAYDGLKCEPDFADRIKSIIYRHGMYMNGLVIEAQAAKVLRKDIESECIADIILGSCRQICLKWRMGGYSFPLKERVLYTIGAVLDSFTPSKF